MDYNFYPDYQNQCKILRGLAADNKLRLLNIGKSLCGRTIYAAKIGRGNPFALIAAGFHGTEYLTVLAALRYAAEYDLPRCVMIVPCVNPDGTEIAHSSYGLAINEGITATLEKDKTYIVKVTHYSNDGHYILSIGQQKETIDITNREIVHDSIEYADQENRYDITTTYGGKYRFDLANVYSGCKANITVFDDHNYKIANTNYGIENNQGLSADLEAGRTYRVTVTQYSGASTYDLKIGKQSATQTISSGESITGNVTFKDQQNRYDYVANSSGEYIFSLSGMRSGVECNISVFDDHDYKIGYSSYGLKSDGSITATLEKGKKYRIVVLYIN